MSKLKYSARKNRLIKLNNQTKWAPFWAVFKAFGKSKRVHPSRLTRVKRSWRRGSTDA